MEEGEHQQVRGRKFFRFYFQWFTSFFLFPIVLTISQPKLIAEQNLTHVICFIYFPLFFFCSIWSHQHLYSLGYCSMNLYKYFALFTCENQMNWWHEFLIAFYIQFLKTWLPWSHLPKRQWYIFLCKPRWRLQLKKTKNQERELWKAWQDVKNLLHQISIIRTGLVIRLLG